MDYVNHRLSDTEARGIANILLKAFGILYNAVPMNLTTSIEGGYQVVTRVFYDSENPKQPRIENEIKSSDGWHMDNVYELHWKKQKFEVTLYSSPEDCGYFSVLPNYEDLPYIFCIIQEKEQSGSIKHEMCFGFDSEKRTFLELFDIDLHQDGTVYRAEDSIESQLKGRFVF